MIIEHRLTGDYDRTLTNEREILSDDYGILTDDLGTVTDHHSTLTGRRFFQITVR